MNEKREIVIDWGGPTWWTLFLCAIVVGSCSGNRGGALSDKEAADFHRIADALDRAYPKEAK